MKSQIRVVGNLALAPAEEHRFTVIDGSAAQKAVAPSRPQLFAPIAYPSRTVLEGAKMNDKLVFTLAALAVSVCVAGTIFMGSASSDSKLNALLERPHQNRRGHHRRHAVEHREKNPIDGLSITETIDAIKMVNDLDSGLLVPGMSSPFPPLQGNRFPAELNCATPPHRMVF